MEHDRLREALLALHDGQLSGAARAEALGHLENCVECGRAYRRLERLSALIRPSAAVSAVETERFVQNVMRRARQGQEPAGRGPWRWLESRLAIPAFSMGLAALALAVVLPGAQAVAPMDALFLLGSEREAVARLVLPPDPGGDELLSLDTEDL